MAARIKKQFSKIDNGRHVGVTAAAGTISMQTATAAGTKAAAHPTDSADPKGLKNYISFDVAHALYPQGDKVDPNQDISDDVSANADFRASQINLDAHLDAVKFGYTWALASSTDVGKLKTVGDLMDLVVAHLS